MRIAHIALWTKDLERSKDFYCKYFKGMSNNKYINPVRKFESYFIKFEPNTTLEIMQTTDLNDIAPNNTIGFAHIAFGVPSNKDVDTLTELLRQNGYTIQREPRTTGDGYYESVVLDPDGNFVEIVSDDFIAHCEK